MADPVYALRGDVTRWLPAGELSGMSRIAASSLASSETIELAGHGFETGDPLTTRAIEGGTLSAPLVAGVIYYAIRLTNSTFKLSATPGGAAIDLTSDGSQMVISRDPPYDDVIAFYSRFVDGFMPAHVVPFPAAPNAPEMVKVLVAELSAKKLQNLDGKSSDIVNAAELVAKAQLERFATGVLLRGDSAATASANMAITTSNLAVDGRGWPSGSLP